jgi:hypothetical protein
MLLRRFYIQENKKAPSPQPKQNRTLKLSIQDDASYDDAAKTNLSEMLPPV